MKSCLIIMHAREIPSCMAALNSLEIDKAWFKGYSELELEDVMPPWMAAHDYRNYILVSDDTEPTQFALEWVEYGLRQGPVFTGWCNISPASKLSTVSKRRLTIPGDHEWMSIEDVMNIEGDGLFETTFAPFALTGASRSVWEKAPFRTYATLENGTPRRQGWGSDFMFSFRLQEMGLPIYSHRQAFVHHLASRENTIVGKVTPEIIFERWQG